MANIFDELTPQQHKIVELLVGLADDVRTTFELLGNDLDADKLLKMKLSYLKMLGVNIKALDDEKLNNTGEKNE